jgi:hypothetical protein
VSPQASSIEGARVVYGVPLVRTTWTIVHQHVLPEGEPIVMDPHPDPDLILWALEEGEVRVTVEAAEP